MSGPPGTPLKARTCDLHFLLRMAFVHADYEGEKLSSKGLKASMASAN